MLTGIMWLVTTILFSIGVKSLLKGVDQTFYRRLNTTNNVSFSVLRKISDSTVVAGALS